MKTLLILRHAKSSKDDPKIADHERPLNDRGRRDAPRMGQLLRDEDLVPDLIVTSTAVRARATAEGAAKAIDYEGDIVLEPSLYDATPEEYLDVLRQVPEKYQRVVLVGHNPGLEHLLEALTRKEETLSTAALAKVTLPIDDWSELRATTKGKLAELWRPKELED